MSNQIANNNQATVTVKMIRGNGKENVSFTQKVYTNLTGTILEASYSMKGEELGSLMVDARATACFEHESGEQVLDVIKDIFDVRTATGSNNPVIYLKLVCSKVSPANGSFLLLDITSVEILEEVEETVAFDVAQFKAQAATIKQVSQEAAAESLERAAATRKARNEATLSIISKVNSSLTR